MGNKNLFLILALVFSTFLGGKVYADNVEELCAQSTGYPPKFGSGYDGTAITLNYNNCVTENRRVLAEQQNAPANPGSPPAYDCAQYQQPLIPEYKFEQCKAEYEGAKVKYEADLANYQNYMSGHPNMNTVKELSAAQVIEDIAAKQQKTSDRLKTIAQILKTLGGILVAVGTVMMATGLTLSAAVLTAAAGAALIAKAVVVLALGAALLVFGIVVQGKSDKIAREKVTTCEQLNKLLTKPMNCNDVKEQTPVDGTFTPTNYGFNGTGGTSEIPGFIDPTTGQCKKDAPAECATMVKNSPKDCFKANSKGVSCMAGIKKPAVTTLANGKVSMNLNGKQRTFGAEDFADEASMMKAGFTKDQAKQFLALTNDSNSILAKNGLSAKGELIKGSAIPSVSLTKPSASADGGGAGGTAGMKTQKDEYGPAQDVARTPASAEGLTKDYHGEKIGAEGDDVFKMINRRYILKQKQNIFLEQ